MATKDDFPAVFDELRKILKKHEKKMVVQADEPGNYCLNTPMTRPDGYKIMFGAAQIKKNYVSYHLMPVYGCPDLVDGFSPQLQARMQGKACSNFKKVDPELFAELARLTEEGLKRSKKAGYMGN